MVRSVPLPFFPSSVRGELKSVALRSRGAFNPRQNIRPAVLPFIPGARDRISSVPCRWPRSCATPPPPSFLLSIFAWKALKFAFARRTAPGTFELVTGANRAAVAAASGPNQIPTITRSRAGLLPRGENRLVLQSSQPPSFATTPRGLTLSARSLVLRICPVNPNCIIKF